MQVIDNFLPKDLCKFLEDYYSYELPHYYGHRSTGEGSPFYYHPIKIDALHSFIFSKAQSAVGEDLKMYRAYFNVQHQHMKGSWHIDDGDLTILYMVTQTLDKGVGCFEIKDGEKIDFVQNRLVWFDGSRYHRGNAPNTYHPRITLVFKNGVVNG